MLKLQACIAVEAPVKELNDGNKIPVLALGTAGKVSIQIVEDYLIVPSRISMICVLIYNVGYIVDANRQKEEITTQLHHDL